MIGPLIQANSLQSYMPQQSSFPLNREKAQAIDGSALRLSRTKAVMDSAKAPTKGAIVLITGDKRGEDSKRLLYVAYPVDSGSSIYSGYAGLMG